MELSSLLTAGSMSGLAAALILGPLWRWNVLRQTSPVAQTSWSDVQFLVIHAVWGMGLGLLFWLSWGLAAVVGVNWWLRGILFGLLCSGLTVLPAVLLGRVSLAWPWSTVGVLLIDALATGVLTGVLCAWGWARIA